jgi:hypothetical protein
MCWWVCASAGVIMTDDFVEGIKRDDAAEAARQRAIAPAQRPRRRTKPSSEDGYAQGALRRACEAIENSSTRNVDANEELFNMGQLIAAGELDRKTVEQEIAAACRRARLPEKEIRTLLRDTETGGINRGIKSNPRDTSKRETLRANTTKSRTSKPATHLNGDSDTDWDEDPRKVYLKKLSGVETRVPMWVWRYDGVGRIQLGTVCMFAGKPSAGKSTATRYFAAEISNGTLPGVWYGYPMNVAIYSPEEQLEDTIAPSLQAHGADLNRVISLGIREDGFEDGLLSVRDENRLIETCRVNDIRALFVDPVISTFDGKLVDANKTSDVRRHLMPYVRVAQEINGIVVCVTHLRKGTINDVMTNINGSSAFGELPRAIFGFATVGDGSNVMEQVKNSAGPTGLKLEYHLPIERGLADDGQYYELPRFEIRGETELSITDLGSERDDEDATTSSADVVWLKNYLQIEQPAPSKRVKDDALKSADISPARLHKARKKLRVQIISTPKPDAPHTTAWCLPGYKS